MIIKKFNEDWDTFQDINNANAAPDDSEMDTIADYAKSKGISYEQAKAILSGKPIISKEKEAEYFKSAENDDFIQDYADRNNITFEDAEEILRNRGVDTTYGPPRKPAPEIKFDTTSHDVVGLPSGQVIYMNNNQIKWFKARGLIGFKTMWKKPTAGGLTPINLGKYCFEDPLLSNIKDFMETITW